MAMQAPHHGRVDGVENLRSLENQTSDLVVYVEGYGLTLVGRLAGASG
jgi:hypothetical protein